MKEGLESWENELWSSLKAGDGRRCPFSDSCEKQKNSSGCFNSEIERENIKENHRFIDSDIVDFSGIKIILSDISGCVRRRKIFELVIKLAQKYRNKNRHNSIPVPDNLILRDSNNLPIEVRYIPLKANHGAVWRLNRSWLIHLNSNDTPARQRFTLCHEIFHILAHCQGNVLFKKGSDSEVYYNESLADHFSANVLIPDGLLIEKWVEIKDINRMSGVFNVPGPVMYISLRFKGLI